MGKINSQPEAQKSELKIATVEKEANKPISNGQNNVFDLLDDFESEKK